MELHRLKCGNLKEISEEMIENITKSGSNFAPSFIDHHFLLDLNFNKHCLIKNNIYIPKKVKNLYISYILTPWLKKCKHSF